MDDLFFGQYLVKKKIVSESELLQAVAYQRGRNRLLGELAVEMRLLTPQQVERTKTLQRDRDIFFGDAAVELGYLQPNQVDELLKAQKQGHVYIGEIVIRMGFATDEAVHQALKAFEAEFRAAKAAAPPPESKDAVWLNLLVGLTQKTLTRSFGVPSRLGIRDTFPKGSEVPLFRWSAGTKVTAPWQGLLVFSAGERVIASIKQGREPTLDLPSNGNAGLTETVVDVATLVCRLSKGPLGLATEGEPKHMERRALLLDGQRGVSAELLTPAGAAHLVVTFK